MSEFKGDLLDALDLVEGLAEAKSEAEIVGAWQFLIDSGIIWQVQGRLGRYARHLIEHGICRPPKM